MIHLSSFRLPASADKTALLLFAAVGLLAGLARLLPPGEAEAAHPVLRPLEAVGSALVDGLPRWAGFPLAFAALSLFAAIWLA